MAISARILTQLDPPLIKRLKDNDPTLVNLELDVWNVDTRKLKAFSDVLAINTTLASLNLSGRNSFDKEKMIALTSFLSRNTTLTSLSFDSNFSELRSTFTKEGAIALQDILCHNSSLTSLKLFNVCLDKDTPTILAMALATILENNSTLTTLMVSWCGFNEIEVKRLTDSLEKNKTLTHLGLWSNKKIAENDAKVLSAFITRNKTITTLGIGRNTISDKGYKALLAALKVNTTLTSIGLGETSISCTAILDLAEILLSNTTLTSLDLSRTMFEEVSSKALAIALACNTTLLELGLFCSDPRDISLYKEYLERNKKLKEEKVDIISAPEITKNITFAINTANQLIEEKSNLIQIFSMRAQLYIRLQQRSELLEQQLSCCKRALADFQRIISREPVNEKALIALNQLPKQIEEIKLKISAQKIEQGQKLFLQIHAQKDQALEGKKKMLADMQMKQEQVKEAHKQLILNAQNLKEQKKSLHTEELASLQKSWGELSSEEIVETYENWINKNPKDSLHYRELGLFYLQFADKTAFKILKEINYKKASALLKKSYEYDRSDVIAANGYAEAVKQIKNLSTPTFAFSLPKPSTDSNSKTASSLQPISSKFT